MEHTHASALRADAPHDEGEVGIVAPQRAVFPDGLTLSCGRRLAPIEAAYETYGTLAPDKSNVILLCHALSGGAHAAGRRHPDDRKPGWWDLYIGPNKALDTNRFFIICVNVLASPYGTTSPLHRPHHRRTLPSELPPHSSHRLGGVGTRRAGDAGHRASLCGGGWLHRRDAGVRVGGTLSRPGEQGAHHRGACPQQPDGDCPQPHPTPNHPDGARTRRHTRSRARTDARTHAGASFLPLRASPLEQVRTRHRTRNRVLGRHVPDGKLSGIQSIHLPATVRPVLLPVYHTGNGYF